MAQEASLTFPLVLLSLSCVFTVYCGRQIIKGALQICGNFLSRCIHNAEKMTRRMTRRFMRRVRRCIARRRQTGPSAEYELLDMPGNTAFVDLADLENTSESEASNDSIYSIESEYSSLHGSIVILDSSSTGSQDDKIPDLPPGYSPRPRHRLPKHIIRGTIDISPQITPLAWEIEHARRMQQGGPGTWLHRLVDWTVERVQTSFEANNPINEENASYISDKEQEEQQEQEE